MSVSTNTLQPVLTPPPPEEPLSSPQPDFKSKWGYTISRGLLVHKMAAEGEVSSLRRRREELTPAIINSLCQMRIGSFTHTKVRESPLPPPSRPGDTSLPGLLPQPLGRGCSPRGARGGPQHRRYTD